MYTSYTIGMFLENGSRAHFVQGFASHNWLLNTVESCKQHRKGGDMENRDKWQNAFR
jgi:hypothetical protein